MTLQAKWTAQTVVAVTEPVEETERWEESPVIIEPNSIQVGDKRFERETTNVEPGSASQDHPHAASQAELPAVGVPPQRRRDEPPSLDRPDRPVPAPRHTTAQVPPSPASVPRRVGSNSDSPIPEFIFSPPAAYPRNAVAQGWTGTVYLSVTIGVDGKVTRVAVDTSSGHAVLDGAAATAVRRWRTRPLAEIGRNRPLTVILPIQFRIPEQTP